MWRLLVLFDSARESEMFVVSNMTGLCQAGRLTASSRACKSSEASSGWVGAEVMLYLQQLSMKSAASERCLEPFLNMPRKYNRYLYIYVYACHELFNRLFSFQFQQYSLILLWGEKNPKHSPQCLLFFFFKLRFDLVWIIRNTSK